MSAPLNSFAELIAFTSFREGDPQSVADPSFARGQFLTALRQARDEIATRTTNLDNDEFGADRLPVVKESELYLATSRLYVMWGERLGLLTTDANMVNVGPVGLGADTPPPTGLNSKMEFWLATMATAMRSKGLALLVGQPYEVGMGADVRAEPFPCLTRLTRQSRLYGDVEVHPA